MSSAPAQLAESAGGAPLKWHSASAQLLQSRWPIAGQRYSKAMAGGRDGPPDDCVGRIVNAGAMGFAAGAIGGAVTANWGDIPVVLRNQAYPALKRTGESLLTRCQEMSKDPYAVPARFMLRLSNMVQLTTCLANPCTCLFSHPPFGCRCHHAAVRHGCGLRGPNLRRRRLLRRDPQRCMAALPKHCCWICVDSHRYRR